MLGAVVLGAVLRLWNLQAEEIWFDEGLTLTEAALPARLLVGTIVEQNKPPLYPLAMHYWLRAFGESEAALRAPSAIFGILTLALLFASGRSLFGVRAASFALLFAAFSPIAIYYAREGRNYAALAFFGLLAFHSLDRALATGRIGWWLSYTFAFFACIGMHFIAGALWLVAALQVLLLGGPSERRRWLAASAVVGAAMIPWALQLVAHSDRLLGYQRWLVPFWNAYPPPMAMLLSLRAFLPGGAVPAFVALPTSQVLQPFLVAGGAALALAAAWSTRTAAAGLVERPVPHAMFLVTAYLFLPLLVPFLYSFHDPVYMVGRTDFLVFPAFPLLIGAALVRMRPAVRGTAVVALAVASAIGLYTYFSRPSRGSERVPLRSIAARCRSGDMIVLTDLAYPTGRHYLEQAAGTPSLQIEEYPPNVERIWKIGGPTSALDPDTLRSEARHLSERIERHLHSDRRVLVLYANSATAGYLAEELRGRFDFSRFDEVPGYFLNQIALPVDVIVVSARR